MKLVTFVHNKTSQLGIIHDGKIWALKSKNYITSNLVPFLDMCIRQIKIVTMHE
jgi:hypothetical protein